MGAPIDDMRVPEQKHGTEQTHPLSIKSLCRAGELVSAHNVSGFGTIGAVLLAITAASAAAGQPRSASGLVDAYVRTDFDGIARAGRAHSAEGLAKLLRSGSRVARRAAIAAAPAADDACELHADLALIAAQPDRSLGPAAARAAAAISQGLSPARISELELTDASLRQRADAWGRLAKHQGLWPDVRVHAIEINALLARTLPADARAAVGVDLVAIASDPEPEVRRAAIELQAQPLDAQARERTAEILREDGEPVVAVVAGQALCGGIAMGDPSTPVLTSNAQTGL
mgnify:CR=1 FL=1